MLSKSMGYCVLFGAALFCNTALADYELPETGSVYRGSYPIKKQQIPLPEGDWVVIGKSLTKNNAGSNYVRLVLANIKENVIHGIVGIGSTVSIPTKIGRWDGFTYGEECNKKERHFTTTYANYGGSDQDCWYVTHSFMANVKLSESTKHIIRAQEYLENNEIVMPINMIRVSYRLADRRILQRVSYYFSPEVAGFPPPLRAEWKESDWHHDRVYLDDKKVSYIDNLIAWGRKWHAKVKSGFEGNSSSINTN